MAQAKEVFLFQPTSVPNCVMWFDAADPSSVIRTGTNVTQWNDKTGNGNTAVAGTATYPIYNTNTLNGNATIGMRNNNDYFLVSNNLTTTTYPSLCYFIVVRPASSQASTSYAGVLSTDTASAYGRSLAFGASAFQEEFYSGFNNITLYTAEQWYIVSLQFTTTVSATLAVNGATYAGTASGTGTNTTGFKIGSYNDSGSYATFNANFDVAEIMVYGADLTTSRRQQIEGYLAWKWGLQTSLSTSHPYRYYRPLANTPIPTQVPNMPIITQNVAAFIPTQISGCQVWLDGADSNTIILSGGNVTQWRDKSGRNNTYTNSGAITYANNRLYFAGSSFLQNTSPVNFSSGTSPALSTFVVFSYINATSVRGIFSYGQVSCSQTGYVIYVDTDNKLYGTLYCGALNVNNAISTNTTYIMSDVITYTGTPGALTRAGWLTGTPMSTTNASTTGVNLNLNNVSRIGDTSAGQNYYGYISEVIYYNTTLSTSQRQQVEGYLAWKWGLTANLPVGHPFRQPQIAPFPYRSVAFNGNEGFWRPTLISGCQLWLDAADSTSMSVSGTTVSQWNDKSGNGYNVTQSVAGSRPRFSQRQITFASDAYFDVPQASMNNATRYSIFFVFYPIASVNWILVKQYNGVGSYNMISMTNYWQNNTGTTNYLYWDVWANPGYITNSGTALSLNTLQLIEIVYDAATVSIYRNGTVLSTLASANFAIPNQTSATNFTMGSWRPDGGIQNSGVTNFSLAEFTYYNTFLTTQQRQQVEGYLAWKWGLQGSLPAGHPYKLWPPPPS